MIILMSYPRSGNHLTRFIVEYITGRPTLGCAANPRDVPIHQNKFANAPYVLAHVKGQPIGHKCHSEFEVRQRIKQSGCNRMLLMKRNPVEAILAHNRVPKPASLKADYVKTLSKDIGWYYGLERVFQRAEMPKHHVIYERLISSKPADYLPEIEKIAEICGTAVQSNRLTELCEDFDELRNISAQGEGRSWAGYRSKGQPTFHQANVHPLTLAWFKFRLWSKTPSNALQ